MNELEQAIFARLIATSAITSALAAGTASIYNALAPQGAAYPLVIFGQQSGLDENVKTGRSRQVLVLVKAITQSTMRAAGSIDANIDGALHFISGVSADSVQLSVSGWTNIWQRRESDVRYTERDPDGKTYHHSGALYRVRLTR